MDVSKKFWEDEIERAKQRAVFDVLLARHREIGNRLVRSLGRYCEAVKEALTQTQDK